jgi:aminoglycoside phosphotransferase (APT) family kinase protein
MTDAMLETSVIPVQERHRFDAARLEAWLGDHVGGYRGPAVVEQFGGGQSNPTYRLTAPSGRYVLRRKPPGKLLASAHAVDREYRVISALGPAGFPVPRTYGLCEDDGVIGTAFYVMDCVEGRVLWNQLLPDLPRAERSAIFEAMNAGIAQLHRIDYRAIGLESYGRPGNYLARQIDRWSKQYRLSETERIEAMDNLIAWLPQNIPAEGATAIVHGDYRMDNMIFHPTEPRILAVIDWELSTLGDPLADVAYHMMYWRLDPEVFRGLAGTDFAGTGIPSEADYVAAYCRRTGRAGIAHWDTYIAYNMFRLAAILQGIMKRFLDGTAASKKAEESGRRARAVAEAGWRQVEAVLRGSEQGGSQPSGSQPKGIA